jgi:general secretion pathway protein M
MKQRLARLRQWYDGLVPRERRLVGLLLAIVAVLLVLALPVGVALTVSARRSENHEMIDAIARIKGAREEIRARQAKRDAIVRRYANKAPPLAGLLEKAARDNRLDVPESRDNPEVPHGKRYVERTTVIRLRKASMLALAKMFEQIEQQGMPVAISKLNIRRRGGEKDSYDVELGLSAFDRTEAPKSAATAAPSGSGGIR